MDALAQYDTINSKKENMLLVNDRDSEIITISTYTNLQYLCNEAKDIFMNGTFKCCPNHFMQLYTIHGWKNGTNIPLVYALSPSKTEQCHRSMWSLLLRRNTETNLNLRPEVVHLDFERAMHNAVSAFFPDTRIDFCRFHLGQCWCRKIQALGLSGLYKDKSTEEGKWLSKFFDISFFEPQEVEESFVEDIMFWYTGEW